MVDINVWLKEVLSLETKAFKELLSTNTENDELEKYLVTSTTGFVDSTLLEMAISQKRIVFPEWRILLFTIIVERCNTESISNEVFKKICNIKRKEIKRSLLVAISHIQISFYQVSQIAKMNICIEAFLQLISYSFNDCFSIYDLERILEDDVKHFVSYLDLDGLIKEKAPFTNDIQLLYRKKSAIEQHIVQLSGSA